MNDTIIRRLQRHLLDGRLVIFAGAGVSAPHVPTWPKLTEFLFDEAEARGVDAAVLANARTHLSARRYPDALSVIERAIGGPQFRAAVEEALDTEKVEPTDAARAIQALSPHLRAVVTTNLDTLLERAFEGRWPAMTRAVGDLGTRRGYIWKLHGTLPDPQTWVMTREQYDRIIAQTPEHRAAFAALCSSYHFLFVGFGLADDDLDDFLDELRNWFGVALNTHYALLPAGTVPPSRVQQLQERGITCIPYANVDGSHREVPQFLRALSPAPTDEAAVDAGEREPAASTRVGSTPGFVGRAFLFDRVRTFVEQNGSGYLFLTGDPGIGKTWFARELIRRNHAVFHFNSRPDHVCSTESFLRNVCRQLAIRAGEGSAAPPAPTIGAFDELLDRAARRVRPAPLMVVVDALDEADPPAAPGVNRLLLPTQVPSGCFVIVTSRRFDAANPAPRVDRSLTVDIGKDPRHREDAREFIVQFVTEREDSFGRLFAAWRVDRATFIEQVLHRSEANFMYLSMVLPALAEGTLSPEAMHKLDALPAGLTQYYWRHWELVKHDAGFPEEERVICLLASAREPLTVSIMAKTLGLRAMTIRAILRKWQQFLRKSRGSAAEPVWSIYHATFQEFLREEVGFEEAESELIRRGLAEFEQLAGGEGPPRAS